MYKTYGKFRIIEHGGDDTGEQDNMVLATMANDARNFPGHGGASLNLGDGDHPPPLATDTALGNSVYASSMKQGVPSIDETSGGFIRGKIEYTWDVTNLDALVTEIGLIANDGLVTKAKIRDGNGDPAPYQMTAAKTYTFVYRIYIQVPITVATGSWNANGITTQWRLTIPSADRTDPNVLLQYFGGRNDSGSSWFKMNHPETTRNPSTQVDRVVDNAVKTVSVTRDYPTPTEPIDTGNQTITDSDNFFSFIGPGQYWPYHLMIDTQFTYNPGDTPGFSYLINYDIVTGPAT